MTFRTPSRLGISLLALVFAMGGVLPTGDAGLWLAPALADDHGGGDDDDDGGGGGVGGGGGGPTASPGGGGSGGNFKNPRKRFVLKKTKRGKQRVVRARKNTAPRRQVARKPVQKRLPVSAPDEVILRGADAAQLAQLVNRGFKVKTRHVARDGALVVKLLIPTRTSLRRARDIARSVAPAAEVDFNHYFRNGYLTQSGSACKGDACKPFQLVGWRAQYADCTGLPDIGIIDTRVDGKHPALAKALISEIKLEGQSAAGSDPAHGTGVAALIAGQPDGPSPGLLPQVRLVTIDVFDAESPGDERTDAYNIAAALDEMRDRGIKVINMSLAGPENDVLQSAVDDATNSGSIIVSAAGNAGPSAPPAYPAAYDNVIAVTAVSDTLSVYRRAGRGKHIDIAAPGVRIPTAGSKQSIEVFTGSSFAVPFVTAAVAVQLSQNAGWRVEASSAALKQSAKDLGRPGIDPVFGAGLLQFASCK